MRKCSSIILILIFLFNIGGFDLWYKVLQINLQNAIRQEIRKGLKEVDLSVIIVPNYMKSGIYWIESNKEFIFNWKMYDVVKVKVQNQKTFYYCIDDKKEKQLIDNFNKNCRSKKEAEKRIKRVFQFEYFPHQFLTIKSIYLSEFTFGEFIFLYNSNFYSIPHPPPELV
jgi:hypothetical protein